MAITHTIAVCDKVAAKPSKTACPTVPRTAMMKAAIMVLECPGSSPCSAPRAMALGINHHTLLLPCCNIWANSFIPQTISPHVNLG